VTLARANQLAFADGPTPSIYTSADAAMNLIRLTLLALALLGPTLTPAAEPRIALVIGNSDYPSGPLLNPVNDAKVIADTLGGLGFEVILRRNADQTAMKRAIEDFGSRLEQAGPNAVGLFYYAGHGVALAGRNYLIPTTARIEREGDVEIEAVSADWVIEQMRYARNRLNIVILDACRNNPFTRSMRSATQGLATMDAPAGILIAYSTAPGEVAADGSGRNSPYTDALSRAMRDVHEPVEQVFKRTRIAVMSVTSGKQTPWEASSLTGDFYFAVPSKPAPAPVAAAAVAPLALPVRAAPTLSAASLAGDSGKPLYPGERALALLQSLGVQAGLDPGGKYSEAALRQLIQSGPRKVTLGSTPEQIQSAFELCRQYSSGCERSWYADEVARSTTLVPFQLDPAPVSVRSFRQFAATSGYRTQAETAGFAYALVAGSLQAVSGGNWRNAVKQYPVGDDSPVVGVSFQDAVAYCRAQGGRLPSEDEWEYVARGPERRTFAWGEDIAPALASRAAPPQVNDGPAQGIGGTYRGLTGTIWQWVDSDVDKRKVLKGGSWLETNPANKRAAVRRYELPRRADEDSGFRCARSVPVWPDTELWLARLR
jgi:uncharacterized caspase-like protein/formylglycine-generating enzyme required for sulfatase activity